MIAVMMTFLPPLIQAIIQTLGDNACHPERSEGSGSPDVEILRCAQDDNQDTSQVRSPEAFSPNVRPLFGFLDFIEILGKELFAYIALAGELLRLQPAAYQVAERLRQLLHGWQLLLTDDIRRVDHANLQSGQQIGDDGSRNICTDQPGMLKLDKIGIGIAYELIEKACIRGSEKPV